MNEQLLTCPMSGHRFDPAAHSSCGSCPLQRGCDMVCCPACGYNTVDVGGSRLARLAEALLAMGKTKGARRMRRRRRGEVGLTLADVPPGWMAKVAGFAEGFPANRRAQLLAYGLVPDYWVRVMQHSPVTVIQVEHTELALERELAGAVQVQMIQRERTERENSS